MWGRLVSGCQACSPPALTPDGRNQTHEAVGPYDMMSPGNSFTSPFFCHSWRVRRVYSVSPSRAQGLFFHSQSEIYETLLWILTHQTFRKLSEDALKHKLVSLCLPPGVWTRDALNQPGVQHQWDRWWENLPRRSRCCCAEERERTSQECSGAEVRLHFTEQQKSLFIATHILLLHYPLNDKIYL